MASELEAVPEHVLDRADAGSRFLRGSSLRLLAMVGGILVGVVATPFVVHHLGPTGWGDYGKVTALLFIVTALTEGGLGQMGVRELSVGGDLETQREFIRDLVGLRVALTGTGVAAALIFALLVGWDGVVVAGTAIAGLAALLTNMQGALALPLTAQLRLGTLASIDFVPQLASTATMLALVLVGSSLLPFYCAPLALGLVSLTMTVLVVRGRVPVLPRFRLRRWRSLLSQTVVYAVATAMGASYFRIALVACSLLSNSHQTGYFALSFRILDLSSTVPWLLLGSAFPILARSAGTDPARLRYALHRLCQGSLILGGWFSFCLIVGAPFGIHVLEAGGNSFADSVPVLRILGAAVAATFLLATFSYTLLTLQLYRQLLVMNAAIVLLAVVLCPVLIPALGAQGAAYVSVILEYVLCGGYAFILFRSRPDLRFPLAGTERVLLALALSFAVGVLLHGHSVIGVLAGTAVFVSVLLLLKAVPAELLTMLRRSKA